MLLRRCFTTLLFLIAIATLGFTQTGKLRFEISYPPQISAKPVDGRVILCISKDDRREPRFQLEEEGAQSAECFGVNVDALAPGTPAIIDESTVGYPLVKMNEIPAGDYTVQAVLNIYETFHRADGHTVKLPPDMGEGQQWNRKPGNLLSHPQSMHIDPVAGGVMRISMSEKIPPIEPPKDTKYVKHIRIESKMLSDFWGRPMYVGAIVVLPSGFDEHPNAHYPLIVEQGHFPPDFHGFQTEPPGPEIKGRQRDAALRRYEFYQAWTSGRLPHMLLLLIQHANPYYDDSYAVNSANVGPYGDAITKELIPEVEKRFRGIGQGWARAVEGGSTGGWEALASQVFYPDYYNDAWVFCPDPIDFHAYQAVNIYDDKNAFWDEGQFGGVPRPEERTYNGMLLQTMEPSIRREEVMGTKGRSTEQWGIWQAVFSPVGQDGYPAPIWDPKTGVIDKKVAAYWQEHYDLNYIMQRDWATLGPKLVGKLHFAVGEMDTWYLNNAVHMFQDFHDSVKNPYKVADFDYGARKPHCYTGAGATGEAGVLQRIMPEFEKRIKATAPAGADMSWQY
jgi:hypothetical protein